MLSHPLDPGHGQELRVDAEAQWLRPPAAGRGQPGQPGALLPRSAPPRPRPSPASGQPRPAPSIPGRVRDEPQKQALLSGSRAPERRGEKRQAEASRRPTAGSTHPRARQVRARVSRASRPSVRVETLRAGQAGDSPRSNPQKPLREGTSRQHEALCLFTA